MAFLAFHMAIAQKYSIETAAINEKIFSKEIIGTDAAIQKKLLDELTDNGKSYPLLPYDTTSKSIDFTYIIQCPGVPQKIVHRRIKEWCALRYNDVYSATRYEDLESGKIITKGFTPIVYTKRYEGLFGWKRSETRSNKCFHTLIFTSIEGKVKMQVEDLRYLFSIGGYSVAGTYFPKVEFEVYLAPLYPIVKNEMKEWDGILELSRETIKVYNAHVEDLTKYINAWQSDYRF